MTPEETAAAYDAEAVATGWLGPEVAFGLVYEHVVPGQSVLDLGIGPGLAAVLFRKAGLRIHGVDVSKEMLDACRTVLIAAVFAIANLAADGICALLNPRICYR